MHTSFTRLTTYQSCPRKYRYRYIDKLAAPPTYERHFLKGRLVHAMLELRLNPENPLPIEDILVATIPPWIRSCGLDLDLESQEELLNVCLHLAHYLYRASSRARKDPIRNNDGSVPKDLLSYPPRAFTSALEEANLLEPIHYWNTRIAHLQPQLTAHNFVFLLAECLDLAIHYQLPGIFSRTIAVEYEISPVGKQGPVVFFPGSDYLLFNARIDWIFEDHQGNLYLVDHKTSREPYTPEMVAQHPQLLTYAYLYHKITDRWPDYIAINDLPSGQLVYTQIYPQHLLNTIEYLKEIQSAIEKNEFPRRHPQDFNSPCVTFNYRSKNVMSICPYLNHCWPEFYQQIAVEVNGDLDLS